MPTLKDVVKEILDAETQSGEPLEGIESIYESLEDIRDGKAKFIYLANLSEENFGNHGNRWSLCKRDLECTVIFRDQNLSVDQIRRDVISMAEKMRKVLKLNPALISASAPAPGFATHSEITEVQDAQVKLPDGVSSHGAGMILSAWYMVKEI